MTVSLRPPRPDTPSSATRQTEAVLLPQSSPRGLETNTAADSLIVVCTTYPRATSVYPSHHSIMSSNRARRIAKEIADIHSDTLSHISANPTGNGDDLTHLKGSFKGPPGTPYEGGTYMIDIRIPGEYPFRPPIMKFDTKVWHPNVSSQTVSVRTVLAFRHQ